MCLFYTEKAYLSNKLPVNISIDINHEMAEENPLHYHDFYEFSIIKSGTCMHHINGQNQIVGTNRMMLIRPEDKHFLTRTKSGGFRYHNVNIRAYDVERAVEFMGLSERFFNTKNLQQLPVISLSNTQEKYIVDLCRNIMALEKADLHLAKAYADILISLYVTYFVSAGNEKGGKGLPSWLIRLLSEMQKEENFIFGITVMPELCGKSPSQIYRAIKKHLGITPTELVNQNRLEKAKNLLIRTEKSVTDIAYDVGFDNMSHFYHLFKKQFGITPQNIRKQSIYD